MSESPSVIPAHEPESHLYSHPELVSGSNLSPLDLTYDDPEELYENAIRRIEDLRTQELLTFIEQSMPELNKELEVIEQRINDWFIERKSVDVLKAALKDYWRAHLKAVSSTKA